VTEDERDLDELQSAWDREASRQKLLSEGAEFLLSISSEGNSERGWLHVRATGPINIAALDEHPGWPCFVASNLSRTVSLGVLSEEHEYLVLVSRTDPATGETPIPTGDGGRPIMW
jgi:hypothetical protein